jgi:DNA polymerase (family 10)
MDNYAIADQFSLLAKLMDIHGENGFRAKSYASAAYNIEQLTAPLISTERSLMADMKGIGESTAKKIAEILDTGHMKALEDIISKTPSGVIAMLEVKGLGPKKISTIWKEMGIESIGELLYACQENRLLLYKGFGAKTQQNVKEAIEFLLRHQDRFLYAELESLVQELAARLQAVWPAHRSEPTGAFRRQCPEMDRIEFVSTIPLAELEIRLNTGEGEHFRQIGQDQLEWKRDQQPLVVFYHAPGSSFGTCLFKTSASAEFLEGWKSAGFGEPDSEDESEIFHQAGMITIPACLRETAGVIVQAGQGKIPTLIVPEDIRGIIHTHSNWSDGSHTLDEMAAGCIAKGYEYLVISDHSRAAQYAGGLSIERIREQHAAIDALNKKLAPFRIFKSIECDILGDGSLDYPDEVLESFDLVIASVHSNLKMSEEKAMTRLMRAIEHPSTTILGHPTGRLLLSRPGYPVDHLQIIEACAKHGVAIEINAHPRRLDLDWTWIPMAMEKGVMLSVDPDAHAVDAFGDVRYGVLAAQKGGLTADFNLSSLTLDGFTDWLDNRKSSRKS